MWSVVANLSGSLHLGRITLYLTYMMLGKPWNFGNDVTKIVLQGLSSQFSC